MTFKFRPAKREGIGLIIGLFGGTGSGKTWSALELATGMSGGKRFAIIDTEAGRATHYADRFAFDHGDLMPPFRPGAYLEAIKAAESAGYPVVIVDSMSHEHAGEGGLLDWHEEEFAAKGYRESAKMTAWIKPKMAHKQFVQALLQLRCHLIICARAEEKIDMQGAKGKMNIQQIWRPVLAKGLEFEMTASFMLHHERPGCPHDAMKLPENLRSFFPPDKPVSASAGELCARWAAGGTKPEPKQNQAGADAILSAWEERMGSCESLEMLESLIPELQETANAHPEFADQLRGYFKRHKGERARVTAYEFGPPPMTDEEADAATREPGEEG